MVRKVPIGKTDLLSLLKKVVFIVKMTVSFQKLGNFEMKDIVSYGLVEYFNEIWQKKTGKYNLKIEGDEIFYKLYSLCILKNLNLTFYKVI